MTNPIKISLRDSIDYYEQAYISPLSSHDIFSNLTPKIQSAINTNPLNKKQFEYHIVLQDFDDLIKKRNLDLEGTIKNFNMPVSDWKAIISKSQHQEFDYYRTISVSHIYKMCGFLLKDKMLDISERQENNLKEQAISEKKEDVIQKIKETCVNQLSNEIEKPQKDEKIKNNFKLT